MMSLVRLVEYSRRHAVAIVLGGILLALLAGAVSSAMLGVSTDTDKMFSERLPWRQRAIAFDRAFPQFQDLIVAVIDGSSPEITDQTAAALAEALATDTTHFISVRWPDASPYFDRQGLLFLEKPALDALMEHTIDAQPFLGQLAADPSARGLFASLALLGIGVTQGQADLEPYKAALLNFHDAMQGAIDGHPAPMSWVRMLGGGMDVPLRADPAEAGRWVAAAGRRGHGCGARGNRPAGVREGRPGACADHRFGAAGG